MGLKDWHDHELLKARVEAIEARQRYYTMHDPGCPAAELPRAQAKTGMYIIPDNGLWDCNCWLELPPQERERLR